MPTTGRRRAGSAMATLVVGGSVLVASVLGLAAPAQAHNYLVSSTPTDGEVLTALPAEFSVTTNEPLLTLDGSTSGFGLQVVDAAGYYYGDGCLTVDGATLSSGATLGAAGDYTLIWQVVSEDGHPVSGELTFSWQPAEGATATEGAASPPVCGGAGVAQPSVTPVPISAPETHPNVDLSVVLWIGGAIAAVLGAGILTFLLFGRRERKKAE